MLRLYVPAVLGILSVCAISGFELELVSWRIGSGAVSISLLPAFGDVGINYRIYELLGGQAKVEGGRVLGTDPPL